MFWTIVILLEWFVSDFLSIRKSYQEWRTWPDKWCSRIQIGRLFQHFYLFFSNFKYLILKAGLPSV